MATLALSALESYLIKKAVGAGRKQLTDEEKALVGVLRSLGLATLTEEIVVAIDSGDYSKAIAAARSIILATTQNFVTASLGISNGPLSNLLGMALEAATSGDNDKLRATLAACKKQDPELADAIGRFLKGDVAAISFLAARRAGANPEMVKIAEGAAAGDYGKALQSGAKLAGLSPEQTGLVAAAYRIYQDKRIDPQTMEAIKKFVVSEVPQWKNSQQDIGAAYTVATATHDVIKVLTSNPKLNLPVPRTIDQAKANAEAEQKAMDQGMLTYSMAMTTYIATIATAMMAATGGVAAPAAGFMVVASAAMIGISILWAKVLQFAFASWTGNRDSDIAFAKETAQKLIDKGVIPEIAGGTGLSIGWDNFWTEKFVSDLKYPFQNVPSTTMHRKVADHISGNLAPALSKFLPLLSKDYLANPDIDQLRRACIFSLRGGPLGGSVTNLSLALVAKILSVRYSVPEKVPMLTFADLVLSTVKCKGEHGFDGADGTRNCFMTRYENIEVDGSKQTLKFDVYPPEYFLFWDWASKIPSEYAPPGTRDDWAWAQYTIDQAKNDSLDVPSVLGLLEKYEQRLFSIPQNTPDYHDDNTGDGEAGWAKRAWLKAVVWAEIVWRMTRMCEVYLETVGRSIGPYATKQQIIAQIALFMDLYRDVSFSTAVSKVMAKEGIDIQEVKGQLAEMGVSLAHDGLFGRQVRYLLKVKKAKDKVSAFRLIEASLARSIPDSKKDPRAYAQWLLNRNNTLLTIAK